MLIQGCAGGCASIVNFLSVYPGLLELGMLPCKTLQLVDGLEVFHRGFAVTFKESFGGRTHSALLGGQQRRKALYAGVETPVYKGKNVECLTCSFGIKSAYAHAILEVLASNALLESVTYRIHWPGKDIESTRMRNGGRGVQSAPEHIFCEPLRLYVYHFF
jgi:hypothetical protein